MTMFRSSLEQSICEVIDRLDGGDHIFCFEFNTPRFNILNIETQKIKKLSIVPDENMPEEFLFKETDKYAWD